MKWLKNRFVVVSFLALIVFLGLAGIRFSGGLQMMELSVDDRLLALKADSKVASPIVIIKETEADLKRFGFPVSDGYYAEALEKLLAAGVSVAGVDKYRDQPVAPGSKHLERVLTEHDTIFWIFFIGTPEQGSIAAPQFLLNGSQIGFNNTLPDTDGVFRRGLLFMDDKEVTYSSFPLLIAQKYLSAKNINPEGTEQGFLRLGQAVFSPLPDHFGPYIHEDMGGYQVFLNYPSLHRSFPGFTLSQLVDGEIPAASLKDKIVLLGSTAPSLNDYKLLPGFKEPRFGVELHAHLIDQILQAASGTYPLQSDWPESYEYGWLFLWCFLGGLASLKRGGLTHMTGILLTGLTILFVIAVLFQALWIPLLPPALGWMLTLVACVVWFSNQERNERQQLLKIFEQHVSPQVAADLWENRDKYFDAGGVLPCQITATVLFSDLAGFTPISETMTPVALMSWLNAYMEEMSNIIMDENGMIKGYMGDGIMAVFGAPAFKDDAEGIKADALSAVASGLRMNRRLKELNLVWRQQGLPPAYMRIGIHTGLAVAGTLGCKQRMEYAVTGETTITASRLESFDKTIAAPTQELPCRILIGEPTWELVRDHYRTEKVGEFQLKGKAKMLNIYQVTS